MLRLQGKAGAIRSVSKVSLPNPTVRGVPRQLHQRGFRVSAEPNWAPSADVINSVDRDKLVELQRRFAMADTDGNGAIDKDELRNLLNSVDAGQTYLLSQYWLPEEELDAVMKAYDVDNSGTITFDEFLKLAQDGILLEGTLEEYENAFKAVDSSGNGTIGANELAELFGKLGQPVSMEKLVEIMQKYDKDESGQIDFPEFLLMFRDKLFDVKALHNFLTPGELKELKSVIVAPEGGISLIFSEEELDEVLRRNANVVLFSGLTWCRPCKAMQRPYQKLATLYNGAVFLKLFGNANANTKRLFKERLLIRSTPCFMIFRNGELVYTQTGSNKVKLETALREHLPPDLVPAKDIYLTEPEAAVV